MGGVPTISADYAKAQNRKVVDNSNNVIDLVKNPNKLFLIIMSVLILLIVIIVLAVRFIVKKVKSK